MCEPVSLAYEEYGDNTKQPLVIIHGFFASSRNWRHIAKTLAEHYHVFVLDMRNHGTSPHHPQMDYPAMAVDLKLFMDKHKLPAANLLGHSMGGKAAMWFALKNPEYCLNLFIADISPVTYQHNFNQTIDALKSLPLSTISNRKQADEFLSKTIPEISYRQFLLQNIQLKEGHYSWRIDLDIFYHTADNIIGFPNITPASHSTKKACFIMGGNSNYLDKPAIDKYFPNAEIIMIEKANHWVHIDNPEIFCSIILNKSVEHGFFTKK